MRGTHLLRKVPKLLLIMLLATVIFAPLVQIQASTSKLSLNKTSAKLKVGATVQLKVGNSTSVKWSSQDSKIATVKDGLVTAKSAGTVNIKAQSGKLSSVCKITVYQPATKFKLVTSAKMYETGDIFTVTANILPKDATYQSLTWSVENPFPRFPNIKQISKNKFEAVSNGTATIVAYQKDTNKTYKLDVNIYPTLGSFHMTEFGKKTTSLTTYPGGHLIIGAAFDDPDMYRWSAIGIFFTYNIADKSIAKVDTRGQITALKPGSTDVIVTSSHGKSITRKLTVTEDKPELRRDTFYVEKFLHNTMISNYGERSGFSFTDRMFLFKLKNKQIGVFRYVEDTQNLEITFYDDQFKYVKTKTFPMPYPEWGGIHQGEDGNYYIVVGQKDYEEDNYKTVYCILKYNSDFKEIGRCNVTGGVSYTISPFNLATARMTMSGNTLIVHTDRLRYTSKDQLNHQSNLTLFVDTSDMKLLYVSERQPYNHVSHSFNQFVKMEGNTLYYVDHGDAAPRSVVLHPHFNFKSENGEINYLTNFDITDLNLLKINGKAGDVYTGTKVNGFELGLNNNLVAGVSIPHDTITGTDISSYTVKNVYVSLIAKDGLSSKLVWLTNYKQDGNLSAENLRMTKISEDKFALVYQIRKGEDYLTGLLVINSNGIVLKKQEYNMYYSASVEPIYQNGYLLWIENLAPYDDYYWFDEEFYYTSEQSQFTRIYLN